MASTRPARLARRTKDPQKNAPRGVLWAIGLSFIAGLLFLGGTILSIKDLNQNRRYRQRRKLHAGIANHHHRMPLANFWGNIYLGVVFVAICVCTLAIQSATIRLMFSMGRDGRLPFGKVWGTVNPTFRTPMWAGIAVAVLSATALPGSDQSHLGHQHHRYWRNGPDLPIVLPEQHRLARCSSERLAARKSTL